MKRFLKIAILALVGLMLFVGPACAGYDHYTINVYKDTGYRSGSFGYPAITSGIQYFVFDKDPVTQAPATPEPKVIYNDRGMSEMRNPVWTDTFDAEGKINFWVDNTDGAVDITIVDNAGGYTLILDNVPPSCHSAIIDERRGMEHHGKIWFTMGTSLIFSSVSTEALDLGHLPLTNIDTGIVFPALTMISGCDVEVIKACTDSTDSGVINVGLSSNLVALRMNQAGDGGGYHQAVWSASCTHGELLYMASCVEAHSDGLGTDIPSPYITVEALSLNYGPESGDGTQSGHGTAPTPFLAGWGFIHYFFTVLQ